GLAPVRQAAGYGLRDAELAVERLEQHRAPVGAGVLDVESGDHKLVEFESELRYTVCGHRASSSSCVKASRHRSFRTLRGLDGSFVSSLTHNPGQSARYTSVSNFPSRSIVVWS